MPGARTNGRGRADEDGFPSRIFSVPTFAVICTWPQTTVAKTQMNLGVVLSFCVSFLQVPIQWFP